MSSRLVSSQKKRDKLPLHRGNKTRFSIQYNVEMFLKSSFEHHVFDLRPFYVFDLRPFFDWV